MSFQLRDSSGQVWDVTITTLGELQATASTGTAASAGIEVAPTGNDIVKGALRVLGAIAPGETPSSEDLADGLQALNWMLDGWNTKGIFVYATTRNTYTLTQGTDNYTIGSAATFNTTRPVRIEHASIIPVGNTFEYPMHRLTSDEYAMLSDKVTQGIPWAYFYRPDAGQGRIFVYTVPSDAHALVLYEESHLSQISDGTSYLSLAPGFARALKYNLAIELAPEWNKSVPIETAAIAKEAFTDIARVNIEPGVMRTDFSSSVEGWVNSSLFKRGY
jgi:hypothetical protein